MRTKKTQNYLLTKDINLSSLNSEVASALPDSKIFINEVLSVPDRNQYTSLKDTAKRLGFEYVWYCTGNFLVRWRNGIKSHAVKLVSDLNYILKSLYNFNSDQTPPKRNKVTSLQPKNISNSASTSL